MEPGDTYIKIYIVYLRIWSCHYVHFNNLEQLLLHLFLFYDVSLALVRVLSLSNPAHSCCCLKWGFSSQIFSLFMSLVIIFLLQTVENTLHNFHEPKVICCVYCCLLYADGDKPQRKASDS